jgi:PD-(D/E)XK nuclease superfamily
MSEEEILFELVGKKLTELEQKQPKFMKFNIFNILSVESAEVNHSKFLAELLDPKGTHGYENIFLQSFLELVSKETKTANLFISDFENVRVSVEQSHTVRKKESRIDIVIETNTHAIVIENKIYAPDQEEQLKRYYIAKKELQNKETLVVYLTLSGKEPTAQSKKGVPDNELVILSYGNHIKKWLEKSNEEAVKEPFLKSILEQYLHIIEQLTGQNSKEVNMELRDMLLMGNNMKTAIAIADSISLARATIEMEFFRTVKDNFIKKLPKGFELYDQPDDWAWKSDESEIDWIDKHSKDKDESFHGIYFRKEISDKKFCFIEFGLEKSYQLWLVMFISKGRTDNILKFSDEGKGAIETSWIDEKDSKKLWLKSEFKHLVHFDNDSDFFAHPEVERNNIANKIAEEALKIIDSDEVKKLLTTLGC